jgi:hypothetical protein
MALLRIPLGCLASIFVRLVLIAAILLAGYLFVAKPMLNKADHAIRSATHASRQPH